MQPVARLSEVESRILENTFLLRLRTEQHVDTEAFNELSALISELTTLIGGADRISKKVAQFFNVAPGVMEGVRRAVERYDGNKAAQIEERALLLNAQIVRCLSDDAGRPGKRAP